MPEHMLVSAHSAVCMYEYFLAWMQLLCIPASGSHFFSKHTSNAFRDWNFSCQILH
jgi:hypothetical protein